MEVEAERRGPTGASSSAPAAEAVGSAVRAEKAAEGPKAAALPDPPHELPEPPEPPAQQETIADEEVEPRAPPAGEPEPPVRVQRLFDVESGWEVLSAALEQIEEELERRYWTRAASPEPAARPSTAAPPATAAASHHRPSVFNRLVGAAPALAAAAGLPADQQQRPEKRKGDTAAADESKAPEEKEPEEGDGDGREGGPDAAAAEAAFGVNHYNPLDLPSRAGMASGVVPVREAMVLHTVVFRVCNFRTGARWRETARPGRSGAERLHARLCRHVSRYMRRTVSASLGPGGTRDLLARFVRRWQIAGAYARAVEIMFQHLVRSNPVLEPPATVVMREFGDQVLAPLMQPLMECLARYLDFERTRLASALARQRAENKERQWSELVQAATLARATVAADAASPPPPAGSGRGSKLFAGGSGAGPRRGGTLVDAAPSASAHAHTHTHAHAHAPGATDRGSRDPEEASSGSASNVASRKPSAHRRVLYNSGSGVSNNSSGVNGSSGGGAGAAAKGSAAVAGRLLRGDSMSGGVPPSVSGSGSGAGTGAGHTGGGNSTSSNHDNNSGGGGGGGGVTSGGHVLVRTASGGSSTGGGGPDSAALTEGGGGAGGSSDSLAGRSSAAGEACGGDGGGSNGRAEESAGQAMVRCALQSFAELNPLLFAGGHLVDALVEQFSSYYDSVHMAFSGAPLVEYVRRMHRCGEQESALFARFLSGVAGESALVSRLGAVRHERLVRRHERILLDLRHDEWREVFRSAVPDPEWFAALRSVFGPESHSFRRLAGILGDAAAAEAAVTVERHQRHLQEVMDRAARAEPGGGVVWLKALSQPATDLIEDLVRIHSRYFAYAHAGFGGGPEFVEAVRRAFGAVFSRSVLVVPRAAQASLDSPAVTPLMRPSPSEPGASAMASRSVSPTKGLGAAAARGESLPLPELLARYCDVLLDARRLRRDTVWLETQCARVAALFAHVPEPGRDAFRTLYQTDLARRLLGDESHSLESEKFLLSLLRKEATGSFTSRMEGMVNDLALSRQLTEEFALVSASGGPHSPPLGADAAAAAAGTGAGAGAGATPPLVAASRVNGGGGGGGSAGGRLASGLRESSASSLTGRSNALPGWSPLPPRVGAVAQAQQPPHQQPPASPASGSRAAAALPRTELQVRVLTNGFWPPARPVRIRQPPVPFSDLMHSFSEFYTESLKRSDLTAARRRRDLEAERDVGRPGRSRAESSHRHGGGSGGSRGLSLRRSEAASAHRDRPGAEPGDADRDDSDHPGDPPVSARDCSVPTRNLNWEHALGSVELAVGGPEHPVTVAATTLQGMVLALFNAPVLHGGDPLRKTASASSSSSSFSVAARDAATAGAAAGPEDRVHAGGGDAGLLCGEFSCGYRLADLQSRLVGCPDAALRLVLHSLCRGRMQPLLRVPAGHLVPGLLDDAAALRRLADACAAAAASDEEHDRLGDEIEEDDGFVSNPFFAADVRRRAGAADGQACFARLPRPLTERRVRRPRKENREIVVDAVVMRVMKRHRRMSRAQLLRNLQDRFPHWEQVEGMLDARLDRLVDSDFLERDASDPQAYRYIP